METKFLIFSWTLAIMTVFFLVITYIKLIKERTEHKKAKMINEFLISISARNSSGPGLKLLMKMDIEVLRSLEYQLMCYYEKNFFKMIIKSALEEIGSYLKDVNELPESPQKDFIKATLKEEIFSGQAANLKHIIFRIIKLNHEKNSNHGMILKNLLLDNIDYLIEKRYLLLITLNQCKQLFENIAVEESIKALMISDFDELINKINQQKL